MTNLRFEFWDLCVVASIALIFCISCAYLAMFVASNWFHFSMLSMGVVVFAWCSLLATRKAYVFAQSISKTQEDHSDN